MKRALSLSFLLLAGIFILAHAVIPHHHHDGIPVFVAHNEQEGNIPNHDTYEYWLSTMGKARLGNDKQIYHSLDFEFDFDLLPCSLILFSDDTAPQINDDVDLLFGHHPYIHYHTEFIACSKGLRAPPVC